MNTVILFGRLTKDVDVKYSEKSGMAIAKFTVACDRYDTKTKEHTADFIPCVAFGKTGENIGNFFAKGSSIAVIGSIRNDKYTDKDGKTRYSTNVVVNSFEFGNKKGEGAGKQQTTSQQGSFESFGQVMQDNVEIPF